MQIQTVSTIVYAIAVSILGFSLLTDTLNAQTKLLAESLTQNTFRETEQLPLDDQARYLQGLETPSASQWNFTSNDRAITDIYQLSNSQPEITITEQKAPEWGNTGDDANYSVLVDVYQFTEETNTSNNQ
jgi:hypothetical protein